VAQKTSSKGVSLDEFRYDTNSLHDLTQADWTFINNYWYRSTQGGTDLEMDLHAWQLRKGTKVYFTLEGVLVVWRAWARREHMDPEQDMPRRLRAIVEAEGSSSAGRNSTPYESLEVAALAVVQALPEKRRNAFVSYLSEVFG
jgi:hypothetical protein